MDSKTIHLVFETIPVSTGSSDTRLLQGIALKAILIQFGQAKTSGALSLGQILISCMASFDKKMSKVIYGSPYTYIL
jgi:hypothetical protein